MSEQLPQIDYDQDEFDFETLEDELRVEGLCRRLLQQFYDHLKYSGLTDQSASELAYAVDYYVRDYQMDFLQQNILRPQPGQIRYFAGNWYITHSIEPTLEVLDRYLEGLRAWYAFLHTRHLIATDELADLLQETTQRVFYRDRIERFLALAGDGYEAWDRVCQRGDTV